MRIFYLLFSSFYFFLPAFFANLGAGISGVLPFIKNFKTPVDFGKKMKGKPIFGSHKTWRGIFVGLIFGMGISFFQKFLYQYPFFQRYSLLNYEKINIFLFGFLLSFGALFGDLFFSFIKRRKGLVEGTRWIPFDQINFVLGAFVFSNFYVKLPLEIWIVIIFISFPLHIFFNHLGFWLKIQKTKW